MELLIARNPDSASSLPYLLRVPLGDGLVFRARDVWPRLRPEVIAAWREAHRS